MCPFVLSAEFEEDDADLYQDNGAANDEDDDDARDNESAAPGAVEIKTDADLYNAIGEHIFSIWWHDFLFISMDPTESLG